MTSKKAVVFASLFLLIILFNSQCTNNNQDTGSTAHLPDTGSITPVPLPVVVPGFSFPEDSNIIYSWLSPYDSAKVYGHAWGIWAGLTAGTSQAYQGDSLLVYQTWLGIGEIQTLIGGDPQADLRAVKKRGRSPLAIPNQFKDAISFRKKSLLKGSIDTNAGSAFGTNFWVAVSYDPSSANYAISNSILKLSVLDKYAVAGGIGNIPAFPQQSINIKPVYFVGHRKDSLIRVDAWPGPPDTAQAFPPQNWNRYVYADVSNSQPTGKIVVPARGSNPSPEAIKAATCNLSDFIYYHIDAAMAHYLNEQQSPVQGDTARAGDLALLVAMHVTTKEINNWTWQTYYWAPDPENPHAPSSKLAVRLRPAQLQGAAAHYALSTAYVEVLPNQPLNGGTNRGVSTMIGYNPYLEAGFGPADLNFPNALNPSYKFGIQTNCMSCHTLATIDGQTGYSADQYISNSDTVFKNRVRLDFAWSIQQAIIKDKK